MYRSLTRLAAGVLVGLIVLLGFSPAARAAGTGRITGQLTYADGQAAAFVTVDLYDSACNYQRSVFANSGGAFSFGSLAAAGYKLQFWLLEAGGLQWYHQRSSCAAADTITVGDGATVSITESAMPAGTITGHLVDGHGLPVANAAVYAIVADQSHSQPGDTDDSGAFQIPVFPGSYTISFQVGNSTQYAYQSRTAQGATVFPVAAGQQVVVDDQLLPTGSISGRFTNEAGNPAAGWFVTAASADGAGNGFTTTDADGRYSIPDLFAGGGYVVSFESPDGSRFQYAIGKRSQVAADRFTVTADGDTVVNDSALPTGSVALTATDAATGASIADFCTVFPDFVCSDGTGQVLLTGLVAGPELIEVYTPDGRYVRRRITVTVVGGQTIDQTVPMQLGATITATITDRVTGRAVPGCIVAQPAGDPVLPANTGFCDRTGTVHIGPIDPGSYTLFVYPDDRNAYGVQWVGASGGTGDQRSAAKLTAAPGEVTNAPAVLLDPAGSITGTVTDRATGAPLPDVFVSVSSQVPGVGGNGPAVRPDANGEYTLSGLGPYQWPVWTGFEGHAPQWSGGVANRYLATPVQVTAGAATTYDVALGTGRVLAGSIRDASGNPLGGGYISAYNAVTGDVMGFAPVGSDGTFQVQALGPQLVKVRYQVQDANGDVVGWYGGADQAHAKVVLVPAIRKQVTISIVTG